MRSEYHELTSELDAREILRYLNELGIKNITGEVLKHFIEDLKKYIKYDLQHKNRENEPELPGPERLHSATTFCSRSRSKVQGKESLECIRICCRHKDKRPRICHSAPILTQKVEDVETLRRTCSCTRGEKKTNTPTVASAKTSSMNLIKVPKQQTKKKSDPVSLYQYYTQLWAKYKSQLPGENNWSELRWQMRQRMAGYDFVGGKESKMSMKMRDGCSSIKLSSGKLTQRN